MMPSCFTVRPVSEQAWDAEKELQHLSPLIYGVVAAIVLACFLREIPCFQKLIGNSEPYPARSWLRLFVCPLGKKHNYRVISITPACAQRLKPDGCCLTWRP